MSQAPEMIEVRPCECCCDCFVAVYGPWECEDACPIRAVARVLAAVVGEEKQ